MLRKIFQTFVSMTYPDFQREMGRCQVFCKNVPENLYIEICGGVLSRVT